jgi:predicted amidohydrolase
VRESSTLLNAPANRADLLLTPELALCGYPPEDLAAAR